uniref:Uncharacterized protein n=1 Tax=Aegilops tauschii subsp. strangulata TaxID=200361 RepID=A0A453SGC6_AEGTS
HFNSSSSDRICNLVWPCAPTILLKNDQQMQWIWAEQLLNIHVICNINQRLLRLDVD